MHSSRKNLAQRRLYRNDFHLAPLKPQKIDIEVLKDIGSIDLQRSMDNSSFESPSKKPSLLHSSLSSVKKSLHAKTCLSPEVYQKLFSLSQGFSLRFFDVNKLIDYKKEPFKSTNKRMVQRIVKTERQNRMRKMKKNCHLDNFLTPKNTFMSLHSSNDNL